MDKIAMQEHQRRVDAVNSALETVLQVTEKYGLTVGHKLISDHGTKLPVTIEWLPKGSKYGTSVAEYGPVMHIVKGKFNSSMDAYWIECDELLGGRKVYDSAKIVDDQFIPGRIHFIRQTTSCVEAALEIETLINSVNEWELTK